MEKMKIWKFLSKINLPLKITIMKLTGEHLCITRNTLYVKNFGLRVPLPRCMSGNTPELLPATIFAIERDELLNVRSNLHYNMLFDDLFCRIIS